LNKRLKEQSKNLEVKNKHEQIIQKQTKLIIDLKNSLNHDKEIISNMEKEREELINSIVYLEQEVKSVAIELKNTKKDYSEQEELISQLNNNRKKLEEQLRYMKTQQFSIN